jgi:hypothetical protein
MDAKTAVQVRFPERERKLLDSYRRQQANPPSRAQAAFDLICRALTERSGSSDAERAA